MSVASAVKLAKRQILSY